MLQVNVMLPCMVFKQLIRWRFIACALIWLTPALLPAAYLESPAEGEATQALGRIIVEMKNNPRGPFSRIRWFCNDGSILAPKSFACVEHGGGRQHGQWSEATLDLQAAGFPIANVLAELGTDDFGEQPQEQRHFRMLLLERFLIAHDNGWIFRQARFYRGALQVEDEEAAARRILQGLIQKPQWREHRFALLFEAVRLLPRDSNDPSVIELRGMAATLAKQDPGFAPLRAKIHGSPDHKDAQRVRDYATSRGRAALRDQYTALAQVIDAVFAAPDLAAMTTDLVTAVGDRPVAIELRHSASALASAKGAGTRLAVGGRLLAMIRNRLTEFGSEELMVQALELAVAMQRQTFIDAVSLSQQWQGRPRNELLRWMRDVIEVAYGTGLLTQFEREQLGRVFASLDTGELSLDHYRKNLNDLARAPEWSRRRLMFYFSLPMEKLSQIEPFAINYLPDRLRASPLLAYSALLDTLSRDAAGLTGYHSELFGTPVALGLHSLNPGLARGTLRTLDDIKNANYLDDSIVIVPETIEDLPPVSGILTAHEGNYLSHVQLLARNLGIPNVVVDESLLPVVQGHRGQRVMLAASPGGIVRLLRDTQSAEETVSKGAEPIAAVINVDIGKLDLQRTQPIATSHLGGGDSGVIVGPKAAQLGELTRYFPQHVSPGLAIPFGGFRQMLEQAATPGGASMFQTLSTRYGQIAAMPDAAQRNEAARAFLARLRNWIMNTPFPPGFEETLRRSMAQTFGVDGSYGVFVRSDTNVEDLPGFTGAGLNLTIPNVVGFDNILHAIRKVWASPFSERAYGWRQALMDRPEHLYAAVLLHKSIPNDISGVMVTADVESGSREFITLVVNEGVAGGVDGQAAETIRVRVRDARVELLNSATALQRRNLLPAGGSQLVPASGAARLLDEESIRQVLAFTARLPDWFGGTSQSAAGGVVADVEFGFVKGRLMLLQIRPFVQDEAATNNRYLQAMDNVLAGLDSIQVDLHQAPEVRP